MSVASAEFPTRLILDAGPLIALLYARDPDHPAALAGFRQLARSRARMITPLPIVFEVFKWLLYQTNAEVARFGLQRMREGLEIVYPGAAELDGAAALVVALAGWNGILGDALVAATGLRYGSPVWTLNYRDLAAFRALRFWKPEVA